MQRVTENILSANEALSLENKLSRNQYQRIRSVSVEKNCKLTRLINISWNLKRSVTLNIQQFL